MQDTTPLLSVRDLSIDFHLRTHILHAVRGVSFDLHKGRTLALVLPISPTAMACGPNPKPMPR